MKVGLSLAVAGVLALSFVPVESVVVPAWSVQIVGPDSIPVEGINVRQVWQDYAVETRSHEEMLVTPKDGKVSFPERRISTPYVMRFIGPIKGLLSTGVHASFGKTSWLIIFGKDGLEGLASYTPGERLPSVVSVKKNQYGH